MSSFFCFFEKFSASTAYLRDGCKILMGANFHPKNQHLCSVCSDYTQAYLPFFRSLPSPPTPPLSPHLLFLPQHFREAVGQETGLVMTPLVLDWSRTIVKVGPYFTYIDDLTITTAKCMRKLV